MVFESLVADLLNRFLGDFVENLDASQLNIGIWGGDVKLENLDIKETALDDLDLPVKLKFGHLSKLVLKIPWKNLYTAPVIANIEGLDIIVVPNKGVKYNEVKSFKNKQDVKQKTLSRLEEARGLRRKMKEGKDAAPDTFAEKMVTQVIKNLQVTVKNIHIRYEDKYTNRRRPFAAGITLDSLDFQTTDENWIPTIHKEAVKLIFKLVQMNSLAVYWNSDTKLISDMTSKEEIGRAMRSVIATSNNLPQGYNYILEPISVDAKLRLNQKPEADETDWTTPKILLNVSVELIGLHIGKYQYQDVLLFLEAQERFTLAGRYLQYRPDLLEYKGHYREWWKFAYTSILEENVRRKRRNWSWRHMKAHRDLVKAYKNAWVQKLTVKSPHKADLETITDAELKLDVFNLNVARQQADMEVDRKGLTRVEDQPQGWGAWAKSWWSGDSNEQKKKSDKDIVTQFEEAMTPEEKAKLFDAIDYEENTPPTDYPKHFVENKVDLGLKRLLIAVEDDLKDRSRQIVVNLELDNLKADFEQRPSARAINLITSIQTVTMKGMATTANTEAPVIVQLDKGGEPGEPWLGLTVDTNPLSGEYDQFVKAAIQPVFVVYHAPSINCLIDVFRPPESVRLQQLAIAAMAKYEDVKALSATGLAHAVEKKSKLVLDICISPATIMIPESGIYTKHRALLVADLGLLTLKTVDTDNVAVTGVGNKKIEDQRLASLMDKAYDKFAIKLRNLQLLFCKPNDDWQSARKEGGGSCMHILKPTGFEIAFHKSSIDDLQIPKIRIFGALPDLIMSMSDERLLELMKLGLSIPPPPPGPPEPPVAAAVPTPNIRERARMKAIAEVDEVDVEDDSVGEDDTDAQAFKEQQVQVEVSILLHVVELNVSRMKNGSAEPYMSVRIKSLGADLQMRTFDLVVSAYLGNIEIEDQAHRGMGQASNSSLFLVENPFKAHSDQPLFSLKFIQANRLSPFFETEYKMIEQLVVIRFEALNIGLHQEAFVALKNFGEELQRRVATVQAAAPKPLVPAPPAQPAAVLPSPHSSYWKLSGRLSSAISLESLTADDVSGRSRSQSPRTRREASRQQLSDAAFEQRIIKTKVQASLGFINITVGTSRRVDSVVYVRGIDADVVMTEKTTNVVANLKTISIDDGTPAARYPHILSVSSAKDMFHWEFVQYNRTDAEKAKMTVHDVDMGVLMRLSELRFVFLNAWLNRLLCWIAPFQVEAQAAAAQAGAAAAVRATEAAKNIKEIIQERPPKIKLDIDLHAPILFVPKKSDSAETLVIDLGRIAIANTFDSKMLQHQTALCDSMELRLTDVKVARALLTADGQTVAAECQLLEPITFDIRVKRNLTFGWYKNEPEIAINAHLPQINLSLSQEDYTMIMHILSGNLAEGPAPPARKPLPQSTDLKKEELEETNEMVVMADTHASPDQSPQDLGPSTRITFHFKMDGITANLYSGSSNLDTGKGVVERMKERAFSGVNLSVLKLSGTILEDNTIESAIRLEQVTMDDKRMGATRISRLLDKRADVHERSFIDIAYKQSSTDDKDVMLVTCPFLLLLCPEFLGSLANFFTVPKTDDEMDAPVFQSPAQAAGVIDNTTKQPTPATTTANPTITLEEPKVGTIKVRLAVEDPEIILIEDSNNPSDTLAMILKFRADVNVDQDGDAMKVGGGITGLEIYSGYYAPKKRDLSKLEVLKSVDVKLSGEIGAKSGQTINVEVGDFRIKVSPSTIRLLSAVAANMSVKPAEASAGQKKGPPTLRKRPNFWEPKELLEDDYWWFREVAAVGDDNFEPGVDVLEYGEQKQQLNITMNSFVFTLEAGTDDRTIPLILLESTFKAEVCDWSSLMTASATMTLQMGYYNETFSTWEPIIEPVESKGDWRSWDLKLMLQTHSEDEKIDGFKIPPKMTVSLVATDMLHLTLTKSCFDLLTKLGDLFQQAAQQKSPPMTKALPGKSPYLVLNETGIVMSVFGSDSLKVDGASTKDGAEAKFGEPVAVEFSTASHSNMAEDVLDAAFLKSENTPDAKLNLRLSSMNTVREVNVSRAETRVFALPVQSSAGEQWQLVSHVESEYGRKLVTLRSIVRVINHLSLPIEVHSLVDTNLELCGRAEPESAVNLPLPMIYTPAGEFFFRPAGDQYEMSAESVKWREFANNTRTMSVVRCTQSSDDHVGFFIQVCAELDQALFENTPKKTVNSRCYTVHLWPPVTFHNQLPFPVQLLAPAEPAFNLNGGESVALKAIYPGRSAVNLKVAYGGVDYETKMQIAEDPQELTAVEFVAATADGEKKRMNLGLHTTNEHGRFDLSLYSPFWMVNNTGLPLTYMADHTTHHMPNEKGPVLFIFSGKDFLSKKKAKLQVAESQWSDEFPLDTVGNSGRVTCKGPADQELDVMVNITLTNSGLTKVVTFTPFYLLQNSSKIGIEVKEYGQDIWLPVPAKSCVGFWPVQKSKRKMMTARYAGTTDECLIFPFTESFEAFSAILNDYIGMYVTCSVGESSVVVAIEDFADGMTPVMLINHTSLPISYKQKVAKDFDVIQPHKIRPYTWSCIVEERTITWTCGDFRMDDGLFKDGIGEFYSDKEQQHKLYWVSFLNGRQRLLMVTDDLAVTTVAHEAYEVERIEQQVTMSLQGVGISLVNNLLGLEIAYVAIASSGVMWEQRVRNRFKPLTAKEGHQFESEYNKWQVEKKRATVSIDKYTVDFGNMQLSKPNQTDIRRIFQTGLWLQYRSSPHQLQIHLKINHLQVDNQLPACVFDIVLAPVPPPKSVAADSAPKPFTELSFMMRKSEHSTVPQIKYFKVLVQEMAVKVDQGFINAMISLFVNKETVQANTPEAFANDLKLTQTDLSSLAMVTSSNEQKAFYDNLHISPLMIHLSFSQGGSSGEDIKAKKGKHVEIQSEFVNLLLKSVGVTLTELQDVVFKLAYFEREFVFYNRQQLQGEIVSHYTRQAIKQLYVLVLGLDIIGNPFGLVRDLSSGVQDFFYEPFQGAILGPEEFAEGLALGVSSLFGHAVGGAAGAVSRITGTLGKGVAALTLDSEYQRKRQEALNRRPQNFGQGMVRGAEGLGQGVFDGVTGVFLKPIEGAREGGVGGFAKGVGKGLLGAVVRPVSGVVDAVSSSLDAVRTVTSTDQEVKKLRPPRYIQPDHIIRPYYRIEAEGNKLLHETDKGAYAATDAYIAHSAVAEKHVFFVTDQRVLLAKKTDLTGVWETEWQFTWDELLGEPQSLEKGLKFELKHRKKGFLGIGGSSGKIVQFHDPETNKYIAGKVREAYSKIL
uniref:Uncharacterized protein n=1 Tax=Plectus sambesii TaxID=2011161 RepID=A0A914WWB3_9BILA